MSDCPGCAGTGQATCGACNGRRFVVAAGGVERCAGCGGQGRFRCAACDGPEPGCPPADPLRRAKAAAFGVLFVLIGWPALLFIDFALEFLLAYAI